MLMPRRYADAQRLIVDAFAALTPQLQQAAKYMLENPEDVGLNSMRTVAANAGVKPATVSRLSKALGFADYASLRAPFRERLRRNEPRFASRIEDVLLRTADDSLFEELRAQEIANVEATLADDNYPALQAAAEALHRCRRIYVLGLRGAYSPAFLFHYVYQLFQKNSLLIDTHAGIFADQLRGMSEEDGLFVVSFRPYTQLTVDAVNYAADTGATIVALTDSAVSPAASAATQTIVAQTKAVSFYHSLTGALAVTQALIAMLVAKKGGDAVEFVREAERQLSKISAYW